MEISDKIMKEAKADVTELVHPLDRQYQGLGMTEMMDCKYRSCCTDFPAYELFSGSQV